MNELRKEITETLNHLHQLFIQLQGSGEVDEYIFSEFTANTDELREKFFVEIEKLDYN